MNEILAFIKAIPSAAASPIALVAYLATIAAWTLISLKVRRDKNFLAGTQHLPEKDRLRAIKVYLDHVDVPEGLTGEQYIRKRVHTYIYYGFIAICATIIVLAGMTFYKVYEKQARADEYVREIVAGQLSDYQSAKNVLSNGAQMVSEAAAELKPSLSNDELAAQTHALARQGLNSQQIVDALASNAGTARLSRVNDALSGAAATVDGKFKKLADCFRDINCLAGKEHGRMCDEVLSIKASIDRANASAAAIPGASFNASGAPSLIGNGPLDIRFEVISAPNLGYLATERCG